MVLMGNSTSKSLLKYKSGDPVSPGIGPIFEIKQSFLLQSKHLRTLFIRIMTYDESASASKDIFELGNCKVEIECMSFCICSHTLTALKVEAIDNLWVYLENVPVLQAPPKEIDNEQATLTDASVTANDMEDKQPQIQISVSLEKFKVVHRAITLNDSVGSDYDSSESLL